MIKKPIKIFAIIFIILALLVGVHSFFSRGKKKPEPKEVIVARVAHKTISLNEFIRRAEFTIRPNYCKGNYNIHKKIILNSLIAEKMLALEAEKNNTDLLNNKHFQRYIQGRREQAMRQWLYYQEGVRKVKLDSSEVKKIFKLAGRNYKLYFFTIDNDSVAEIIKQKLNVKKEPFAKVYKEYAGTDTIPEKELKFNPTIHNDIYKSLYQNNVKVNQIIGPLKLDQNLFIVLKVKGWTDYPAISSQDKEKRLLDVKQWLSDEQALKIYDKFVSKIMKGKGLKFNPDIFRKIGKLLMTFHYNFKPKTTNLFLNLTFNKKIDEPLFSPNFENGIEKLKDQSFFKINGHVWTVKDFINELEKHPLVFRKKIIEPREFPSQFKLAIVDMIRDHYLTKEAYKRRYDKINIIKRNEEMWKDAILALYQEKKYLKDLHVNVKNENQNKIIEKFLNPYIDSLQTKYSDMIEINVHAFEKIQLTRIDMFAIQENVPFPIIVPSFPLLTTDHKLDYGKKMKKNVEIKL